MKDSNASPENGACNWIKDFEHNIGVYCNDEMFPYFFEQCIFLVYMQSQSKRNLFESLYLRISTDSGNFNPQKSLNAALPRQGRLFITYSTINRSSSVWLSIHLVCRPCRITLKSSAARFKSSACEDLTWYNLKELRSALTRKVSEEIRLLSKHLLNFKATGRPLPWQQGLDSNEKWLPVYLQL